VGGDGKRIEFTGAGLEQLGQGTLGGIQVGRQRPFQRS
jgi:hypothetical protein